MTSILEALFYGNIQPFARHYEKQSPYMEAAGRRKINFDKLMKTLNDSQKETLEKYMEAEDELRDIAQFDTFSYALKLGILLMAEVFVGSGEVV